MSPNYPRWTPKGGLDPLLIWKECPERRVLAKAVFLTTDHALMLPLRSDQPTESARVLEVMLHDKFLRVRCVSRAGKETEIDLGPEEATRPDLHAVYTG
jgi:hypothetical protein